MDENVRIQTTGRRWIEVRKGQEHTIELEIKIGDTHIATLVLEPLEAAKLRDVMMQITQEPID